MRCLDENVVVDFVEGKLVPELRAEVVAHLDQCDACRELVARTSEALVPTGPVSSFSAPGGAELQHLPRGARVDRYRIIDVVGAGAMGVVYAAEDTVLRRSVALKVVRSQPGRSDEALRARLLREARAACAVRHPHVVPVHDVLELPDGSPVLVMDLLSGETLRSRLERTRVLTIEQTIDVFLAVLSALETAHALGVVHRDLKPENIFLCASAAGVLDARIVDFGVAKLTATDPGAADTAGLTETGALVGTPYYMSPEQAFGEKDIDGRADLWAVGVMLYECVSGVRPTEARNVGQVLKTLAHLSFRPLTEVVPEVPAGLAALVQSLLCERDRRLPSASIARGRLASVLQQPAAAQTGVEAIRHTRPTWVWLAAPAAVVLAIAGAWLARPRSEPPLPEPALASSSAAPIESPVPPAPSLIAPLQSAASTVVVAPTRAKPKDKPPDAGALAVQPSSTSPQPGHLLMTPPF